MEKVHRALRASLPILWLNEKEVPFSELKTGVFQNEDLYQALKDWEWAKPLLLKLFPETERSSWGGRGSISSPLMKASNLKEVVGLEQDCYLKRDDLLQVCGSVKARGGLFEVLLFARRLCNGDCNQNALNLIEDPVAVEILKSSEVVVGSTGNLGLSVGIAASALGMGATVHLSKDAKTWKKNLLRNLPGVTVVEHEGSYTDAMAKARSYATSNDKTYFVDDENSRKLFLGYSSAAFELIDQLKDYEIKPSVECPLFVYIPCGVGGAPSGICYGLKMLLGSAVKVFFAEPVAAPCVTLSLATGQGSHVSIHDFGLDGKTEADGLAVGRSSPLCIETCENLVTGCFTATDNEMFMKLHELYMKENIFIEVSCCAGLLGPTRLKENGRSLNELSRSATHVFWATGGSLVPKSIQEEYLKKAERFVHS